MRNSQRAVQRGPAVPRARSGRPRPFNPSFPLFVTATPFRFIIVDHQKESRELLVSAVRRKFAECEIFECRDCASAAKKVSGLVDAVVVHRGLEIPPLDLVKVLRRLNAHVPIVVVSSIDRSEEVLAAGATGFLRLDECPRLGLVVMNAIKETPPA